MKTLLENAYNEGKKHLDNGIVADYIPELARESKENFGISIVDRKGEIFSIGHREKTFSIQSISKVMAFLLALESVGFEEVNKRIDMKGTALAFNSMEDLILGGGKPRNPMVNAGAMMSTAIVYEKYGDDSFDVLLSRLEDLCGNKLELSEEVYVSERDTAFGNRALINYMTNSGYINSELDINAIANTYFKTCSILVNVVDLSVMASVIANDGYSLIENKQIFDKKYGKILRTLMAMAGMYDYSGEYALRVGLPSKSGVGGGIIAAEKSGLGIATYCPGLDQYGNSHAGIMALECLSKELELGIY